MIGRDALVALNFDDNGTQTNAQQAGSGIVFISFTVLLLATPFATVSVFLMGNKHSADSPAAWGRVRCGHKSCSKFQFSLACTCILWALILMVAQVRHGQGDNLPRDTVTVEFHAALRVVIAAWLCWLLAQIITILKDPRRISQIQSQITASSDEIRTPTSQTAEVQVQVQATELKEVN